MSAHIDREAFAKDDVPVEFDRVRTAEYVVRLQHIFREACLIVCADESVEMLVAVYQFALTTAARTKAYLDKRGFDIEVMDQTK